MTPYVKIWEMWSIFFPQMFLKIISVRFMDRNLVKNVINEVNLVKIGQNRSFLVKMVEIGSFFLGGGITSYVKFWEIGQQIFSLKVTENDFIQSRL